MLIMTHTHTHTHTHTRARARARREREREREREKGDKTLNLQKSSRPLIKSQISFILNIQNALINTNFCAKCIIYLIMYTHYKSTLFSS